ncbi:MAG: hypothetical protein A2474_04040 [Elusimicrobia bacterium RIFOXYC2_FULL_34_12]|nr:MAG: hypothetical protein A2474_04040 [Elusimicrobia bacterium RIFOXYC2_FULL_34_12]
MDCMDRYEKFSSEKFKSQEIFQILRDILFHAMRSEIMQKFDELGLSFNQRNALRYISLNDKCTPGKLSKMLSQETAAIARLIRSLEKKRLITRTEHDSDRRKRHLQVTEFGKELLKNMDKIPISKISEMTEKMSKDEKEIFWYGLQIMLKGFEKIS